MQAKKPRMAKKTPYTVRISDEARVMLDLLAAQEERPIGVWLDRAIKKLYMESGLPTEHVEPDREQNR